MVHFTYTHSCHVLTTSQLPQGFWSISFMETRQYQNELRPLVWGHRGVGVFRWDGEYWLWCCKKIPRGSNHTDSLLSMLQKTFIKGQAATEFKDSLFLQATDQQQQPTLTLTAQGSHSSLLHCRFFFTFISPFNLQSAAIQIFTTLWFYLKDNRHSRNKTKQNKKKGSEHL